MIYTVILSNKALKDAKNIKRIGLRDNVDMLIQIIENNPFQNPPPYKKLKGFSNKYSRRINKQHRLVYEIINNMIIIDSMWTHYE